MPRKNRFSREQRPGVALVTESAQRLLKVKTAPRIETEVLSTEKVQSEDDSGSSQSRNGASIELVAPEASIEEAQAEPIVHSQSESAIKAATDCERKNTEQQSGNSAVENSARQPANAGAEPDTHRTESKHTEAQNKSSQHSPQRFGSYELIWELCKDALSTTWAAKREGIERPLALRIFNARVTDSIQVRNIQKAARKAAELTHSNHVTVYETGVGENGAPYVVSDWVEGDTLADTFIATKRLDIATFLNIFNQTCEALMEAHSHQLVHGNLSPNKIILVHQGDVDTDMVKLIDFGMPADPVQNAFYLSPEQCLDRNKANDRSDIYSLGCIMYESLVGSPPFIGDKVSQASTNYLHELANQYGKDSPEYNALKLLDCIIVKCLQKKPSKRFRSIRELMDAMRLVNDCICGGSTKRLPPKADKLLLFRFLDFFDKKIVACMCAYLILGLVSLKYLGELQLQKHIDEAQLAGNFNLPVATTNWRSALSTAQLANKPPSLQAILQWELADSLKRQFDQAMTPQSRNAIGEEARKHYEEAYKYYSHGNNYRSYALSLLQSMSDLWLLRDKPDDINNYKLAGRKELKKLFAQKKYKECANLAAEYAKVVNDDEISFYAGSANEQIGMKLPPKEGLRYFDRALHYFDSAGQLRPDNSGDNRAACLRNMGFDPNKEETELAMGCRFLEDGDLEAAQAELKLCPGIGGNLYCDLFNFQSNQAFDKSQLRQLAGSNNAIEPLERLLKLQEKAYGEHDPSLVPNLVNLAFCYRAQGMDEKALATYKRLLEIVHTDGFNTNDYVVAYVDLLRKTGHHAQARKELEKRVTMRAGMIDSGDMLYVKLLETYAADKMKGEIHHALARIITIPEPAKLVTYESYYGHPAPKECSDKPEEYVPPPPNPIMGLPAVNSTPTKKVNPADDPFAAQ